MNLFKKDNDNMNDKDILSKSDFLNREILINTITPQTADELDRVIRFWNSIDDKENSRKPIKIFIDCFGNGPITAMFTIIDAIKMSKTPVYTIGIGAIYKEAFFVFLAGHKRYVYPRATFFYKKDLKAFNLDDDDTGNYEAFCEKQALELKNMVLSYTKINENDYDKKNTWWIDSQKAYDLKICHEVLRQKIN